MRLPVMTSPSGSFANPPWVCVVSQPADKTDTDAANKLESNTFFLYRSS